MPTVRSVTYDLLRSLGMTTIFGNPGSTEEPFLEGFPADFRYVLGLQEATVVGMADGFAQATGRAAFVNLHTAPGVGFAMGNVIAAWANRAPLVLTAGQQTRQMLGMEPWLLNREAVELPKPYVKWSNEPVRAEDVPAAIERAYHAAMQQPAGPAFVSIPMDDWDAAAEPHRAREVSHRTAPDPAALDRLAERVAAAERPLLVTGAGVDICDGWDATVALAELLNAPVWAAPAPERVGFPQTHPLFQGFLPMAKGPLAERIGPHDLVLVIGAPVFRYYPYVPGPVAPPGTEIVMLTEDPAEAARAPLADAVVGDVGLAAEGLLARLAGMPPGDHPAPPPRPGPGAAEPSEPITPAWALRALAQTMPPGTTLVEEAASNRLTFFDQIRLDEPGRFFATGSGGLGYAMPAAVGAQIARPGGQVVCVIGDGAAMFSPQALWTAAREHAPVVFLILNNGQYAILKAFAAFGEHGDRVPGLDLPGLDFAGLARSLGCRGARVTAGDALVPALREAFDVAARDRAPTLLDVVLEPTVPDIFKGLKAVAGARA